MLIKKIKRYFKLTTVDRTRNYDRRELKLKLKGLSVAPPLVTTMSTTRFTCMYYISVEPKTFILGVSKTETLQKSTFNNTFLICFVTSKCKFHKNQCLYD